MLHNLVDRCVSKTNQGRVAQDTVMHSDSRYCRDSQEDCKKGLEYLFEFSKRLSELHPDATDMVTRILQQTGRY